jgi:hypothetical protein
VVMKNLTFSSVFCAKIFDYLPVKLSLSSSLAPALHGRIPNSFRRNTARSVLVSLALFSLSCLSAHAQTTTPVTANFCANEGGVCSFSGTQQVRYGANAKYVTKTFTNGTACTNGIFGDPIPGTFKTCAVLTSTPTPIGIGNGLKASYRNGTDAVNSPIVLTRTDAKINFNWGLGAPDPSIPTDRFSVKWEGEIQPRYTGEYTFYGTSDDGNTIIINGQTVVYDPNLHAAQTTSGKITLEAGKKYPIAVFFSEATGDASMKLEWSSANQSREVVPTSQLYSTTVAAPVVQTPTPTPTGASFTQAQFEAAIAFDFEGENGKLQSNPSAPSVGYPCGVPNNYSWKFGGGGLEDVAKGVQGRGQQLAGAAYNQIYNACPGGTLGGRKVIPNARILTTDMVVSYFSISQQKWVTVIKQPTTGAAFAEDFVNNEATGADFRDEASGYKSVRSGINNAQPVTNNGPGSGRGRFVQDESQVGYNFHGFGSRFEINWADVKAIVLSQSMRCIPNAGTDLSDCKKLGYIADVGLDSWASTTSSFDDFKTHGGVSGGRFKPVTTDWQVFTNYSGPRNFSGIAAPAVPQF